MWGRAERREARLDDLPQPRKNYSRRRPLFLRAARSLRATTEFIIVRCLPACVAVVLSEYSRELFDGWGRGGG